MRRRILSGEINLSGDTGEVGTPSKVIFNKGSAASGGNIIVGGIDYDLTVNITIQKTISSSFSYTARVEIVGFNPRDYNILSTIGLTKLESLIYNLNSINLYSGWFEYDNRYPSITNTTDTTSLIFSGQVLRSYPVYGDVDRKFILECYSTAFQSSNTQTNYSKKGMVNVTDIYSDIVSNINSINSNYNLTFTSYKLDSSYTLRNPNFVGSTIEQLKQLQEQSNTHSCFDNGILYAAPLGNEFAISDITISPDTGLIGYPTIDEYGIRIRIWFNPAITLGLKVTVLSYLPDTQVTTRTVDLFSPINTNGNYLLPDGSIDNKVSGEWYVYSIDSRLTNNGEEWYSDVGLTQNSFVAEGLYG